MGISGVIPPSATLSPTQRDVQCDCRWSRWICPRKQSWEWAGVTKRSGQEKVWVRLASHTKSCWAGCRIERDVSMEAGRSKAKRKGGGKIEKKPVGTPVRKQQQQKKKVVVEEVDPGVRQPDDYYKYGPYGPYWWRAGVIGEPVEGKMGDKLAVTMTTVSGDAELEEQAKVDATINYDNKLKKLNEDVGLHYFWAFARSVRPSSVPLAPWEDWTLVAQIAVESDGEVDKWSLGFRLDQAMRNVITQCVAWCRPDLTFVRKPKYQLRTENQLEFIQVLCQLVNPDFETDDNSYFGKLCRLLKVDLSVTEEDAAAAYDQLAEHERMKVLEHLLTNHPVNLLYPFSHGTRTAELRKKKEDAADAHYLGDDEQVTDDEEEEEEEEVDEEPSPWDEYKMFGGREGLKEGDFKVEGSDKWIDDVEVIGGDGAEEIDDVKNLWKGAQNETYLTSLDEEDDDSVASFSPPPASLQVRAERMEDDEDDDEAEILPNDLLLKAAAVRPFTYRNLVKEVVFLRRMLQEDPWRP